VSASVLYMSMSLDFSPPTKLNYEDVGAVAITRSDLEHLARQNRAADLTRQGGKQEMRRMVSG
jgi:hypothetical protein